MSRARGVALMTALIVVAIATAIAAAIFFDTGLVLRRSEGTSGQGRALLLAGGAEALAARILGEELDTGNAPIHPGQRWANPLGPIEVEDAGVLQGQLIDLQGRFNLNSLIDKDGRIDPVALEIFERLLRVLELEPAWAPKLADWIDADDLPSNGGAEDDTYTALRPGYRPPNRPVTSISELLLLPGFDMARFARLAPHVAALPRDASINLCTATPALLDALADERQWLGAEDDLARNRERDCFPRRDAFKAALSTPEAFERLDRGLGLGERSRYFQLQTTSLVGTARFSLYSLLRYEPAPPGPPRLRVMLRRTTP
ncbi:MAG: general secretion pathway protein GspK [Gammaproteobacteria bacterium]|nr:general secretion pathway protein GspK [Gammaproteobacteria bacterium]